MDHVIADVKLARDRRILKAVDARLSKSLRWLVVVILPVLGISLSVTAADSDGLTVLLLAFFALLFMAPLIYLCVRFEHTYGAGPARWRRLVKVLSFAVHGWLGVVIAIFWLHSPGQDVRWFMPLAASILLVYEIDDWAPYFEHHALQIVATWLPLAVSLLLDFTLFNGLNIGFIVAFAGVLLLRTREGCQRFWRMQAEMHQHRYRASQLSNEISSAQSTSRNQANFLTGITREIRTPLNNVLGALALLDDTELSPQQRQLQQVALRSGESLLVMTEDIMDFGKIASGNLVLESVVFNLRKCVESVIDSLGPMAHERKMEILLIASEDIPVRVVGDKTRLAQVIHNLVQNALVYSHGTEVVVELEAHTDLDGRMLATLAICDNGKGIPAAQREVMFQAFSSVEFNEADVVASTGLGLAICSGLVKAMGGEIRVESETGKGATFRFSASLQASSQQSQNDVKRHKSLTGWRTLLVALSPMTEKSVRSSLAPWEMVLESHPDAVSAVQCLRQAIQEGSPYQMVVFNCPFEIPSGLDFLQGLREDPKLGALKIMVLATLAQKGTLGAAFLGMSHIEWVVKPLTHERVSDALHSLAGIQHESHAHQVRIDARPQASGQAESEESRLPLLLVEDNKVNQLVARGMLQKLGYDVTVVNNGREAVGILHERAFAGILMDCIMPEMDGYEATRAIRAREAESALSHAPIIAMTANAGEAEKRRCLDAGMDDYLSKPVDLNELEAKLRQWLPHAEEKHATTEAVVNTGRRSA